MHFTSITSMSWYIFILPKINLWTAWWSACLPGVFIQEFFKFHSIYYLSIEKDFVEVRNTSNFFTYGFRIYQLCAEWWCLVSVSNWSIVIFTFTCYYYMKQLFQKSKIPHTHLLMSFKTNRNMAVYIFVSKKLLVQWLVMFASSSIPNIVIFTL